MISKRHDDGNQLKIITIIKNALSLFCVAFLEIERVFFRRKVVIKNVKLNGCFLDKKALRNMSWSIGSKIGVNGIYCPSTDSAALLHLDPPGNSMLSNNPDSIIESLKSARKLHDFSLAFAGVIALILVMGLKSIPLPFFTQIRVDPVHFLLIAVLFSAGLLILAESFMHSAYEAAQFIDSRDSAMKVGHFPWTLSKYDQRTYGKWITTLFRVFLCAHPLIYTYFYYTLYIGKGICPAIIDMNYMGALVFFWLAWVIYFITLIYSVRIFWLSQKFQKPILFDPETERNRKSDASILNERVSELIELLMPKESK